MEEISPCDWHRSCSHRFFKVPWFHSSAVSTVLRCSIDRVRSRGFDASRCLIDLGETAEATTATALKSKRWDCVVIGAGLRQPPEQLLLFERIVNLVHALAPTASICFNTRPDDTAEAVERWLEG